MIYLKNKILEIVEKRKDGINAGIPSFCSANKIVIETILEEAKKNDEYALIEATSNQVNQFGGYMNMQSKDFKEYVYKIADELNFDKSKIILGGDHLGPLPWANLDEETAMNNAKKLVYDCVLEGYTKIHLDTSMKLGSDSITEKLSNEVIAKRGAILFKEAERAYTELLKKDNLAIHPVYVIGSEVPIPGGIQEKEEMKVTEPYDFEQTILAYKKVFHSMNLDYAWKHIVGVVVQPGVEFGSDKVTIYDRKKSKKLCKILKKYPDIVFEGHSTDYQPSKKLQEMVEDGIAIIKVGPALTNALREGLFALSHIEKELIDDDNCSHFIELLEEEMLKDDSKWINYYHGTDKAQKIMRKYSFSDRSRYYISLPTIQNAINTLIDNLKNTEVPLYLLHQYFPNKTKKIISGELELDIYEILKDCIAEIIRDYNIAVNQNFINV